MKYQVYFELSKINISGPKINHIFINEWYMWASTIGTFWQYASDLFMASRFVAYFGVNQFTCPARRTCQTFVENALTGTDDEVAFLFLFVK